MVKRVFDFIVGLLGLTILIVPILCIYVLVFFLIGHPVFFTQMRPGLNGAPFKLIKFRSMTDARDSRGQLLSDSQRLTRFGQFLRSSSLDELPELWNVIKGEMSLVGPRPLLMEYLPLYSSEQKRRHNVRPGITGLAQISGRNAITWQEKFELDIWYVENQTFWLDVKIILLTIKKVLKREGISASGEATMSRFRGNNEG